MHARRTTHLHAVKRTFRYLRGTFELWFATSSCSYFFYYCCLFWCRLSRLQGFLSTTGYVVFFSPNLISWHSKKLPTVSKSSIEAKYPAVAYTIAETIWIRKLLHDLCIHLSTPTKVYCDNINASYMAVNPALHDRSKHIALDYHFVPRRL